jgi:esterase/lipase superfamily enzyme
MRTNRAARRVAIRKAGTLGAVEFRNELRHSPALGHDMEHRVYGSGGGQPLLAFPSLAGRVWDWEGFDMVDALSYLIDGGRLTLICADGIDWQSWTNGAIPPGDRARRHEDYDRYLAAELIPALTAELGRETLWTAGCSMGAYHAANTLFRHPDQLDGMIAVSGLYQPRKFVGDYSDETVYLNSPLWYLPNLEDEWYLERYRRSRIVFCVGQGAWEDECLADTREMQRVLAAKGVAAEFDYWGHDVEHDWPQWRRMIPYWLERLGV